MRLRFKSLLTLIFVLIIALLTMGVGYFFYNKKGFHDAIVIVDGNITVNFLNGNEFSFQNDGEISFSVTNNSENEAYYYIQFAEVKGDLGQISYEITNQDNTINLKNDLKSDIVSSSIVIPSHKTETFKVHFINKGNEEYQGKILVGLIKDESLTFLDVILANNKVSDKPKTNLGTEAVEDEGLIKDYDDLGTTYYFRGNVLNNYVLFNDLLWRIVRINGDGTVKLVLNETIDVLSSYNGSDKKYVNSKIQEELENWYDLYLKNVSDSIANYKFCNDYTYDSETNTYYAYNRIMTDFSPVNVCLGEKINKKIGLLTADEVMYAGGSNKDNKEYYLYNKDITTSYYTMTSAKDSTNYYPFVVSENGALKDDTAGNLLRGIRPVINIVENVKITGTGTQDDPYIIYSK